MSARGIGAMLCEAARDVQSITSHKANTCQYEKIMNQGFSTICWRQQKHKETVWRIMVRTYRIEDMRPCSNSVRYWISSVHCYKIFANSRQWEDDRPVIIVDPPSFRDEVECHDDHQDAREYAQHECEPEPLENLGHLQPEVRPLDLLLRRAPGDIVREQMRE